VRAENGKGHGTGATETVSLKQAIATRQESSMALRESMDGLFEVLEDARVMGGAK
jgi:type I restriction enzyme M protein